MSVFNFALALITFLALPVWANDLSSASATADCNGYSLSVTAIDLTVGTTYVIDYSFTLSCGATGSGSIVFTASSATQTLTASGSWSPSPLTTNCTVTGSATLTSSGSTVPIIINGQASPTLSCGPTMCTGAIGDFVWNDLNGNGIQDAGEPGINGITVQLTQGTTTLATTITSNAPAGYSFSPPGPGGSGYYQFTGLCAGSYTVVVPSQPGLSGFTPTITNAPGSTPANDSNGSPAPVTLATDSSVDETIDFGYVTAPCTIPGVTISNTSWNSFNIPAGTSPFVWVHAHIGTPSGVSTTTKSTVLFTGATLTLNSTTYALPDGLLTFDPAAPSTITTTFDTAMNRWETLINPSHLSDEIFFLGAAIPVTPAIAAGAKATFTYNVVSSDPHLSFPWQWSAAVYTFWPTDWNQAMIQPYHQSLHAGTPLNTTVQKSLIQGPRGGGGSNFTGSWSATGTGKCPPQ